MNCGQTYQGNSFPHMRGAKCTVEAADHVRHANGPLQLTWEAKTPEMIAYEAYNDQFRPPECCQFPGLKDIETQHYLALQMNEQWEVIHRSKY